MGPKIYRAGVSLAAPPVKLPQDLSHMEFAGGKYSRFVLTGPYANLGHGNRSSHGDYCRRQSCRCGMTIFIENYVNDPRTTPEDQLITEILVPTI